MTMGLAFVYSEFNKKEVFMTTKAVLAQNSRRFERWAWLTTWILPIGLAFVAAVATELSMRVPYGAFAVLCALALLVTAVIAFIVSLLAVLSKTVARSANAWIPVILFLLFAAGLAYFQFIGPRE